MPELLIAGGILAALFILGCCRASAPRTPAEQRAEDEAQMQALTTCRLCGRMGGHWSGCPSAGDRQGVSADVLVRALGGESL